MTRSRSCLVVGEISGVTVWFASGRHISCTPAVVNANIGEGEIGGAALLHTHTMYRKHIYENRLFTVKIPEHNKHSGTYTNVHGPTIRIQATII